VTRFLVLSHVLRPDAPVWPGNPPAAAIRVHHAIARGDDANETRLELFSHSGTHVDTPWHFNDAGPRATEVPIEAFVFEAPRLLDIPTGARQFVELDALKRHAETVDEADLLLLRTGWSAQRATDPARYATEGPLLHPDAAHWLIDGHPGLRGIATDAISIGSPHDHDASVATHHALTGVGRTDGRYILIFEDVAIVPETARARRVYAWPLFIEGADGSPCTIVAELDA